MRAGVDAQRTADALVVIHPPFRHGKEMKRTAFFAQPARGALVPIRPYPPGNFRPAHKRAGTRGQCRIPFLTRPRKVATVRTTIADRVLVCRMDEARRVRIMDHLRGMVFGDGLGNAPVGDGVDPRPERDTSTERLFAVVMPPGKNAAVTVGEVGLPILRLYPLQGFLAGQNGVA